MNAYSTLTTHVPCPTIQSSANKDPYLEDYLWQSNSNSIKQAGPVQRPSSSSFSSSNTIEPASSRCIQRPASDYRSSHIPECISTNERPRDLTSFWHETTDHNLNSSHWSYPTKTISSSTTASTSTDSVDDFPLYDPFNSGAGLTLPTSSLLKYNFKGFIISI